MTHIHTYVVVPVGVLVLAGVFGPSNEAFSQAGQECALRGNRIVKQPLCPSSESNNPFCVLSDLAPVQSTDRVIWDGSFQSPESDCQGPGGRWVGETGQQKWHALTRYVDSRSGDGELVLIGGIDQIRARVFGQSFGEAAARFENEFGSALSTDVVVPRSGFLRVSFTASLAGAPDDCLPAWVQVRFGIGENGETPEPVGDVEGAGQNDRWSIQADSEVRCTLNLPLPEDSAECPDPLINLRSWYTMVQFGVDQDSNTQSTLRIDDLDVRFVPMVASTDLQTNLVYRDAAQTCGLVEEDTPSWTLITKGHWSGGGLDDTTPIAPSEAPCFGDADGDRLVNVSDLLIVINHWGSLDPCSPGDLNQDGATDISDLQAVLGGWGACE